MKIPILLGFSSVVLLASCGGVEKDIDDPAMIYNPLHPYFLPVEAGRNVNVTKNHDDHTVNLWAIDLVMPEGRPIVAAASGTVVAVVDTLTVNCTDDSCLSNHIHILHDINQTEGRYVHIQVNGSCVKKDDHVLAGDIIGLSGNVGNSTEPHLHFETVAPASGTRTDEQWQPRFKEVKGSGLVARDSGYISMNARASGGNFTDWCQGNGRFRMEGPLTIYDNSRLYALPYQYGYNGDVTSSSWMSGSSQGYRFNVTLHNSSILASRSGAVIDVEDSITTSCTGAYDPACPTNYVTVEHTDGTTAKYSNFRNDQICVNIGDAILQGDKMGFGGAIGNQGDSTDPTDGFNFEMEVWSADPTKQKFSDKPYFRDVQVRNGLPMRNTAYVSSNTVNHDHCLNIN